MKIMNKILGYAIAVMVGGMVLVCCWQVITRFILGNPSKYTDELLRYALIWATMLGIPYAYGQDRHISINIITKTFSKKANLYTKLVIEVIVILLSATVFIMGGMMVTMNSSGQLSPALQMPMEYYYLGLPISGVLIILYSLSRIFGFVKELKEVK